jgi:hypothetical protein
MATKDDRPGLLSKVAMFVRNPTKDWSELDQPLDSDANGYDKKALKAMIERKRQNDFVRKREFDQLRKLRDRDPSAMASLERQSFFQNSLPSDLGGRAITLKKIDEIEAQMSRQWWKNKQGEGAPVEGASQSAAVTVASLPDTGHSVATPSDSDLSAPFAVTVPVSVRPDDRADFGDEFIPTQMAADMASVPGMEQPFNPDSRGDGAAAFSASGLFELEDDAAQNDPELEEGAIRFANSDDAGAEKGLLAALRAHVVATPLTYAWAGALLDLYRATHNRPGFEAAFYEFAVQLDGARPVWFALGDPALTESAQGLATGSKIWECPAHLTAQDMDGLRRAMELRPMPWYLGWSELEQIGLDAVNLLDAVFGSLCMEAVTVRFDGEDRLVRALRALTPSGKREVPKSCWQLRLNALRCMDLQDDFELAALDFCVTYGVAPPSWVSPRCRFEGSNGAETQSAPDTEQPFDQPSAGDPAPVPTVVLEGQVMGDAVQAFAALHAAPAGQTQLIACRDLVRVDFAAAGGILNWVVMRSAEGSQVQFLDVNRMVAAFFNVIGINEHAKVTLRPL